MSHILARRDDYYRLLRGVTFHGAWEPWLRFMLDGVAETASWTTTLLDRIVELMQEADDYIRAELPTVHSHELLQLLFTYPYARIGNLVDAGIAKRQTASSYLQRLAAAGVVEAQTAGREKLFLNTRLLSLLSGAEQWPAFGVR